MTIIVSLLALLLLLFSLLLRRVGRLSRLEAVQRAEPREVLTETRQFLFLSLAALAIALLVAGYVFIRDTPLDAHFMEWLNLLVRWFHITIGIAWIGASFYFVFLENSLNRTKNLRDELAGNLWAIHGGGFYYVEKFKTAPKEIPRDLHWFKYEAYFTWISGFALLWIVYYFNADAMLIDKNVADLSTGVAISIGIASLLVSWLVYDLLCRTPLIHKGMWFSLISFGLVTALAWFLSQVFSSRAAYIHIGAILGTLMAGNVFRVIIPSQKAMVKAAVENEPLDPGLGQYAGLRSLHNNYMTLPVLFVMISNHFPSTFGHPWNWAVLAGIALGSAVIKHYHNLSERGSPTGWVLLLGLGMLVGIFMVTAPRLDPEVCRNEVAFMDIYPVIQQRCTSCHSATPTDKQWAAPPNGVAYDTPQEIAKMKDKIMQRVVITKTMPQNNQTGMTPEERELLRCWIQQGAKIE